MTDASPSSCGKYYVRSCQHDSFVGVFYVDDKKNTELVDKIYPSEFKDYRNSINMSKACTQQAAVDKIVEKYLILQSDPNHPRSKAGRLHYAAIFYNYVAQYTYR